MKADRASNVVAAPTFLKQKPTEEDAKELEELNAGMSTTPLPPTDKSSSGKISKHRKVSEIDHFPVHDDAGAASDSEDSEAREVKELNGEPNTEKEASQD